MDWDADGDQDIVFGTIDGKVHWSENLNAKKLQFADPSVIDLNDDRKNMSDAAPCVADWDSDGLLDLLVGAEDGSVHWFKNVGTSHTPKFSDGTTLIPTSPIGWSSDLDRNAGDWGLRVRPHVADWNGDGQPDLLIGDYCGGFESKPDQSEAEIGEELRSLQALPKLRARWSEVFRKYRRALRSSPQKKEDNAKDLMLAEINSLKNEIEAAQAIIERYQPQRQAHGFVWLFKRKGHP